MPVARKQKSLAIDEGKKYFLNNKPSALLVFLHIGPGLVAFCPIRASNFGTLPRYLSRKQPFWCFLQRSESDEKSHWVKFYNCFGTKISQYFDWSILERPKEEQPTVICRRWQLLTIMENDILDALEDLGYAIVNECMNVRPFEGFWADPIHLYLLHVSFLRRIKHGHVFDIKSMGQTVICTDWVHSRRFTTYFTMSFDERTCIFFIYKARLHPPKTTTVDIPTAFLNSFFSWVCFLLTVFSYYFDMFWFMFAIVRNYRFHTRLSFNVKSDFIHFSVGYSQQHWTTGSS